jgi:hypothetical protein
MQTFHASNYVTQQRQRQRLQDNQPARQDNPGQ